MEFLLLPQGSSGDVNPFIGIGRALRSRDHNVTVGTGEYFREPIEQAGLRFTPLGTIEQYHRILRNPDLWHPSRGTKVVFGDPDVYEGIRAGHRVTTEFHERHPAGVVAAGSLALGARVAKETHPGLKLATLHLQPCMLRSFVDPPVLAGVRFPAWIPRGIVRGYFWLGDRLVDGHLSTTLSRFRRELGLPDHRRYLKEWIHSPERILGLFPKWYAEAPDWPGHFQQTGFVQEDAAGELSDGLRDWLGAGPPPVVFTFGSAMIHGAPLFRGAVDACRILGCRGLLLTKYPEQFPRPLPDHVRHEHFAPLLEVLRRSALLVHHGGIGTTARGLQAGVPQIIVPLSHDQFDNVLRIERLEAGGSIPRKRFIGQHVAAVIERSLGNAVMKLGATRAAEKFQGPTGNELTATALEEFASGRRPEQA